MNAIYRQTYDALDAEIQNLTIARDTIGRLLGLDTPTDEPPATRRGGRRKATKGKKGRKASKATRRANGTRAPKAQAPAAAAPPPTSAEGGRVGRQPSPASAACRSSVLLALLAASNAQSFTQIRDSIAGVMKKNGVPDEEALTPLLQMTQTALRQKGLIERAAGAWKLTDAGREEALRIRAAVKKVA